MPGSPTARRWMAAAGFIGLVAGILPASPASATPPTGGDISTVAGGNCVPDANDDCTNTGDGAATEIYLHQPNSPVFDSAGNMYFADRQGNVVRKVVPGSDGVVNGGAGETISTVTAGPLDLPTALAVDSLDNLLIADQRNNRVQYVNLSSGVVTKYGQAIPPGTVVTVAGGIAATAGLTLSNPSGVAVDPANQDLYIADLGNRVVRKLTSAGAASTVVGAAGAAGFNGDGCAVGTRSVSDGVTTNASTTVTSATASFGSCDVGAAISGSGIPANARIASVTSATTAVLSHEATATATSVALTVTPATLRAPMGVTVSGSKLFVTDQGNHNVRLVNLNASGGASVTANNVTVAAGNIATVAGCSSACSDSTRGFSGDGCTALGTTRSVSDGATNASTTVTSASASFNSCDVGARILGSGIPADTTIASVTNATTAVLSKAATATATSVALTIIRAPLNFPFSTAVDGSGNLYISDEANDRVRVVDSAGTIDTYAGTGAAAPPEDEGTPGGPIYTALGGQVFCGHVLPDAPPEEACPQAADPPAIGDGDPAADALLNNPRGLAVHSSSLYIADSQNQRVRRVNPIS